jgi:hypothetical protein
MKYKGNNFLSFLKVGWRVDSSEGTALGLLIFDL